MATQDIIISTDDHDQRRHEASAFTVPTGAD